MSEGPRIVGVVDGDPFGSIFAGSSRSVFTTLRDRGALAGAVSSMPGWVKRLRQAGAFSPRMAVWKQRHFSNSGLASPLVRGVMSELAIRRMAAVDPEPDVALQLTHWVDARSPRFRPRLRCSFSDAPTVVYRDRPDLYIDPDSAQFRRTLDFEARVYCSMDFAFTKSEWARRAIIDNYGAHPDQVVAVGGGPNVAALPAPIAHDFSTPRILFLGRSFERKGGTVLLDAFRTVRAQRPDAELLVAGPREQPFPDEPGVRFIGFIDKSTEAGRRRFDEIMREATVYAMPTHYDAFGNPLLEAMAYGLPCVTSDTTALPEIVLDGETGALAKVGEAGDVAARILQVIEDPSAARAMGEAGRRRVHDVYNWDAVVDRMLERMRERLLRRASS